MNAPTVAPVRWRDAEVGGSLEVAVEHRADGSTLLRSTEALAPYPARLTDRLDHWAQATPQRSFVARRAPGGEWVHIDYATMRERARAAGQALLELGLSVERPLVVLSGNDLEHLTLQMAAMVAGVPVVPVSTAYSLVSRDYGKLRHILGKVTPGAVFASDDAYRPAIEATVGADTVVIAGPGFGPGSAHGGRRVDFDTLLRAIPGPRLEAAHAATGPDTILKFLFTSGSTKAPKGVITTHRMACALQQALRQCLRFMATEPPVLVDWLPWNHVFGGSHNIGLVLFNGGTLYIDDGRPTPAGIAETLRNLREVAPTIYFNVPRGLEEIARAMEQDAPLRERFFSRCRAFMFAGAGLSQAVWDQLHALAEQTVGERVRVITGLGMTEMSPSCTFALGTDVASGDIGLPVPGVEGKLVPVDGKLEARFRGPTQMPGYWREPLLSAEALDEEGYYRTGDAVRWIDEANPQRGLRFDGRIAEDFKLATGTFVSVGPLRARIIGLGDPCVQDAVIAGINRNEIAALLFPRADDCRALAGLGPKAPLADALDHPAVQAFFQALVDRLAREATGSSNRVARLHVLREPPSIDLGEITDKGSINQRAVLAQRAALVEAVYATHAPDLQVFRPA